MEVPQIQRVEPSPTNLILNKVKVWDVCFPDLFIKVIYEKYYAEV